MKISVAFTPQFVRDYKKLPAALQVEVKEKIATFGDTSNHRALKVHKLKGRLADRYSFSVNYKTRIVFRYLSKTEAVLLTVGSHDIYK